MGETIEYLRVATRFNYSEINRFYKYFQANGDEWIIKMAETCSGSYISLDAVIDIHRGINKV